MGEFPSKREILEFIIEMDRRKREPPEFTCMRNKQNKMQIKWSIIKTSLLNKKNMSTH